MIKNTERALAMKVSTKGRYALRMMIDLAKQQKGDSFVPLRDIADRQGIEIKYLEQIVSLLKKSGLIQGVRGNSGGSRLTRDPAQYTVREILQVTEGNLAPVACLDNPANPCPRREGCPTLAFWEDFSQCIGDFLEKRTLQDFLS